MSKKPHSGLKRALAWMLTVAMMAQGCIVYADDFTSEPDAAVVEEAAVSEDVDTSACLLYTSICQRKNSGRSKRTGSCK